MGRKASKGARTKQGLGKSLRDRAGGLRPEPVPVSAVPALIAFAESFGEFASICHAGGLK